MKSIHRLYRRLKIFLVIVFIGTFSLGSYSFADDYFEISKNLDIFASIFRELNIYYVDETNPGEMMKTGIDAMLGSLDPYTNYYPESDIEDFRFLTTGQYGGIGSLIMRKNDSVIISEPYEGFPAHKAGLMAGDVILEVNGKSATGKTTSEMSKILKGQPNTTVDLLIKRPGTEKPMEKTLVREAIKVDDVPYYGMISEEVGYIKLTGFTETASSEVKKAFKDLQDNKNMKQLVFDLRGNGGGLLKEAVNIVNFFVERGQDIVETKGKLKEWERTHKALNAPLDTDIPIVVLIDGGSASASEIVSGALQDLDRGVLVGQKSFGKGLVQQTRSLSYNSKLKLTVAKYYIPSGRCIQKLDYSHKDNLGRATEVPDSLITEFTTKNGRKVFDGAGISPDISVEARKPAKITGSLVQKTYIFDYATLYRQQNPKVAEAKDFRLSEEDYNGFVAYLEGKDYSYETKSEKLLKDLEKISRSERYFDDISTEYDALKQKMERNKSADLIKFKDEISEILENEIVSRYYFQSGRVEASLAKDPDLAKALEILKDKAMYDSILNGTFVDNTTKEKE